MTNLSCKSIYRHNELFTLFFFLFILFLLVITDSCIKTIHFESVDEIQSDSGVFIDFRRNEFSQENRDRKPSEISMEKEAHEIYECGVCLDNQRCNTSSGKCQLIKCEKDTDCSLYHMICSTSSKVCIEGCQSSLTCPTKTESSCSSQSDCKANFSNCIQGKCIVQFVCCRAKCTYPCQNRRECGATQRCTDGCCR